MMNKQETREGNDSQILIEDLAVNQDEAGEVKGGPESRTFFAYEQGFRGGVFVAAGDLN
jgi:hypothetical protein